ncbi:hypothetical protein A1O3_07406 [Capronia epimyces CBS 606.96]|uniref:Uncharacterized protein n=1 Tax=Capronia epimyces CBS 606.96 TaxID=1182542 RepID=W9XLM1_9EURO|nr:uncharacterized protein A1O3_07406 [Capronia epimyces CBS 606.96]EXJ81118.1 hypothetical protein A1O3_07406 [Capronia epimyces CBS 606.96]
MSQTAPPTETHKPGEERPAGMKDNAFVAFYNDYDLSELLYRNPVFESGFLPLDPEDEQQAHSHAKVRPAETSNTGTTPPPAAAGKQAAQPKSAMKTAPQSSNKTRGVERRPSFIEVSMPKMHEHELAHHGPHARRRHSSESHVPMSWWPEDEMLAQIKWVERDCGSADEEEDLVEEEMWVDTFYE